MSEYISEEPCNRCGHKNVIIKMSGNICEKCRIVRGYEKLPLKETKMIILEDTRKRKGLNPT